MALMLSFKKREDASVSPSGDVAPIFLFKKRDDTSGFQSGNMAPILTFEKEGGCERVT